MIGPPATARPRTAPPETLGALFRRLRDEIRRAGLSTPELDARWLTAQAVGRPPQEIVLHERDALAPGDAERAQAFLRRRLAGEPVDRILGFREFWGLTFRLSPATLSPRPDTEAVVTAALDATPSGVPVRVLDLGTGTGAILVAILHERPEAFGVGVDLSRQAATSARDNAVRNGVGQRAAFLVGDWASALVGPFDLLVANPPYIADPEMEGLDVAVRGYDPELALRAGPDGLAGYRAILSQAPAILAPGSAIVLELGAGQEADVVRIAEASGLSPAGPARRDLGGIPRALVLRPAGRD